MFKTFEERFTVIKNYHGVSERKVYHSGRMTIPPQSNRLIDLCHNDRINELLLM